MSQNNNESPRRGRRPDRIKEFLVKEDTTLLPFLFSIFPDKSKTTVKAILAHKQVAVGHTPTTKFDAVLHVGDKVMINFDSSFAVFKHPRMKLIYEDDLLLVVDKGYGLLSMSTDRIKENTAYHLLSDYVKATHPANRVFILHRLDRDTSGVMMFAKKQDVQEYMQRNWNNVVLERKYVAVVEGNPEQEEGQIESYLTENAAYQVYSTPNKEEGQIAITNYNVVQKNSRYAMVEVELETGRKNQIRVHMQEMGHPIAGDRKYGAAQSPIGRLALHASTLVFTHPVTQERMVFEVPVPKSFHEMVKQRKQNY